MHVTSLQVTDFRSYPAAELDLGPGTTLLLGPNGQGKTNLVEALGYLATLGSHRVATDAPLIRAGAERAVVRAEVDRAGRRALLELEIAAGRANRARLNRNPVRRSADILGTLRTVLFAPEDLALVKGEPGGRRDLLDGFLAQLAPRWSMVRSEFDRIVRQRTALLRSAAGLSRGGRRADLRTLEAWDDQLVAAGAELTAGRLAALARLRPETEGAYRLLSGGGSATVGYRSAVLDHAGMPAVQAVPGDDAVPASPGGDGVPGDAAFGVGSGWVVEPAVVAAALRVELERRRTDEVDRGQCLVGPHRDDVVLGVGDLPAKGYASHGESWSLALALRLAMFAVLRQRDDAGDPVLVLDDVFAELDDRRRGRLAELVADAEQVIVTAAVPQDVPEVLRDAGSHAGQPGSGSVGSGPGRVSVFQVRTGEVTRAA